MNGKEKAVDSGLAVLSYEPVLTGTLAYEERTGYADARSIWRNLESYPIKLLMLRVEW